MEKKNIFISIIIVSILFMVFNVPVMAAANETAKPKDDSVEMYEKARVIEVINLDTHEYQEDRFLQEQMVKVKILTGKYKGQVMEARNTLSGDYGGNLEVEPGDTVILYINQQGENISEAYLYGMARASSVNYIILLFIISLILIGRIKGIKYLVVLGVTVIALYKFLLPLIITGHSPVRITVVAMSMVVLVTIIINTGLTRKSLASILGAAGGVVVAGLLAIAAGHSAQLTGLSPEAGRMLLYIKNLEVDMQGLLVSGIIIGATGAIIDVSTSITTAVEEARKAYPAASNLQMIRAGMDAGRNIMGTMVNTLILAYTGGALPFLLLFMVYNTQGISVFNSELVAMEVVRAAAGSIGLIFTIPITAFFAGVMVKKNIKQRS